MVIYAKSARNSGIYGGMDEKERLAEHTIHDLKTGHALIENLPFIDKEKKKITKDLEMAIALHDVGKAATGFQRSLEKGAKYWGHRHEILSAAFASSLGVKEEIIFAIITHHKSIPGGDGCLKYEEIPYHRGGHIYEIWNKMAAEWNENIPEFIEEWRKICIAIHREDLLSRSIGFLPALSDNMGTNWLSRLNQPDFIPFKKRYYASLLRGLLISADHIASSGSSMPVKIPILKNYNITTDASKDDLRGFQIRTYEYVGNLMLRAPTGSGKTLAAILWAKRNQKQNGRLFYVLPTTASINAMYLRLKGYFSKNNDGDENDNRRVGALHARVASYIYSLLEDDSTSLKQSLSHQMMARNVSSLAREMYYPIRVCTPHQILRYSLQGKGWELMLSEFPNSVFVFDEIHAYNANITGFTIATAKFIIKKGGTCIFLSATLPRFIRKLIERNIPSIGFIEPSRENYKDSVILSQKRHIIEIVDKDILECTNIDLIVQEAQKTKSTLVVCNYVPTAQQVYRQLKRYLKDTILLLHSQFSRRDRNDIEKNLYGNGIGNRNSLRSLELPKILVSTQVVEVSLDIDFGQGFSEPAPIDAIVQRMGRVNRYAKKQPVKFRIFREQHRKSYDIYEKVLTDKSVCELSSLTNPVGEKELNDAADRVYDNGYSNEKKEEYEDGLNYIYLKKFSKYLTAGTDQNWVDEIIDRDSEGTTDLLPEQLMEEYNVFRAEGRTIDADNLLVPVSNRRMGELIRKGYIDKSTLPNTWILRNCHYSSEAGLEYNRHI